MCYVRRNCDGHTMELKNTGNLTHTCRSKAVDKNKLAHTGWVANKVEQLIRSVRSTRPCDVQEAIWTKYGVNVSYSTTWNAWTIYMEMIVGSYDEGYISMPENLYFIQWFNRGWLNGCRPLLGLDGYFLKGKYGGVCLSIIGLDENNGLFPIAVFFCRHMYKNMKKYHKGTHLEKLVWGAAKAWKQTEKEFLDQLKLDDPAAYDWLHREPYERCCKYVATCNLPIHAIDDPSEWGQVLLQLQPLNCHMKKTCKGSSAQPSGTSIRQRNRLDTNSSRAEHRRNVGAPPPPPPPQTPIVRGRGRGNSARGGRGSANSNNESGTSTNTRRGNGKNMGRATATRGRGTAAKTGNNANANTGRRATSNIGRGAASNIGRAPFQPPRPAPYVVTQSSQTTSVTNPYKKAYQTPTRNWKP
ncbi:hypothetical protein GIB67_001844 [Kingdonia uniflora]|uniref:Uncharacterized protein n=1 Tax=Kingdonia uniflora TaxID=39325 RepID=A0A7J7LBW3_9MAGN|nr:hypothetical protein GIB67_001844 [Kingdonia uniflora]